MVCGGGVVGCVVGCGGGVVGCGGGVVVCGGGCEVRAVVVAWCNWVTTTLEDLAV